MSKGEPWLSKPTNSFSEAFPNVEAIDFEIKPDLYESFGTSRPIKMTQASARPFLDCLNPRCQRGGFDFGQFLMNHTYTGKGVMEIDEVYPCYGDEGTPAERRKGPLCMLLFHVRGSITFK